MEGDINAESFCYEEEAKEKAHHVQKEDFDGKSSGSVE